LKLSPKADAERRSVLGVGTISMDCTVIKDPHLSLFRTVSQRTTRAVRYGEPARQVRDSTARWQCFLNTHIGAR
jgi:hypothetical protein